MFEDDMTQTVTLVVSREEFVGVREYTASLDIYWTKTEAPEFSIQPPEKLFITYANEFEIIPENFDFATDALLVEWSVSPGIA